MLPTEDDCRQFVVSNVEPTFAASYLLDGTLSGDLKEKNRNTMLSRRFPGGSLKVVAAKAPRNLRGHNVRILVMDEVDGMDPPMATRSSSWVKRGIVPGPIPGTRRWSRTAIEERLRGGVSIGDSYLSPFEAWKAGRAN